MRQSGASMERANKIYRLSSTGFVDLDGGESRFIRLSASGATPEWSARQAASMDEYLDTRDGTPDDPAPAVARLFGCYLRSAAYGRSNLRILDIGCGIGTNPPEYAAALLQNAQATGNTYVGLDPIGHNVEGRA